MNRFFNSKLYLEGLKKVKLVGIACAIVCLVINAAAPLICSVTYNNHASAVVPELLNISALSAPLLPLLCFAPLFVLVMFEFLNNRSRSDFYHAIPYKRTCVYGSFMAAALSWLWAIALTSLLLQSLLWWLSPYYSFAASNLPLILLAYLLATAFLGGVMAIAMMLTGTLFSNLAMAALLVCFVRVLGLLIVETLAELIPVFDIAYSVGAVLQLRFCLPFALILTAVGEVAPDLVFNNAALLLYSLAASVLLLALGGWLYKKRRSEIAGQSAPNKTLQHVYRCAFTLPFVLLTTSFLLLNIYADYSYEALVLIMLCVTLIVYFLYELITTKSLRGMLRATPWLLVLVAAALIFGGVLIGVRSNVLHNEVAAADIATVSFYTSSNDNSYVTRFERLNINDIAIHDEKAAVLVASALRESLQAVSSNAYNESVYIADGVEQSRQYSNVKIVTDTGKTMGRRLLMTQAVYKELRDVFLASPEFREAYLALPADSEIADIYMDNITDTDAVAANLWQTFKKEYAALSEEEQISLKNSALDIYAAETTCLNIAVQGEKNLHGFYSAYNLPQSMTETIASFVAAQNAQAATVDGENSSFSNLQLVRVLLQNFSQEKDINDCSLPEVDFTCYGYYGAADCCVNSYLSAYFDKEGKDSQADRAQWSSRQAVSELLLDNCEQKFDPQLPFVQISINCWQKDAAVSADELAAAADSEVSKRNIVIDAQTSISNTVAMTATIYLNVSQEEIEQLVELSD